MYRDRIHRLQTALATSGLDAVALNASPNLFHLTGLSFHLMERPVVAILGRSGPLLLITPELERSKAQAAEIDLEIYTYGEDMASRQAAFHQAIQAAGLLTAQVGVDPLHMRFLELNLLAAVAPQAGLISGSGLLENLRARKDSGEIESLRRAVAVAEAALQATLPMIQPGMSEQELAGELTIQLLRAGSATELPFAPIVASGPNSALPHAVPGERRLESGDVFILDFGARVNGYVSDITRTFVLHHVDPEFESLYQAVLQANAAGLSAAAAGATGAQVDHAARQVIEAAGYGDYFIHRTGHGIGLEAHEPPYITAENHAPLELGHAFTVEPGAYQPGRWGVRIEDDVIITPGGGLSLTSYPRQLIVL
jgi:Xaa-Pro dipeptidase